MNKPLKKIDISVLLDRQLVLDNTFNIKDTLRKRNERRLRIAYITEVGELAQELKHEWNWWKNSTKEPERQRVLEELSDILHFYLSQLNTEREYLIFSEDRIYEQIKDFDIETAIIHLIDPKSRQTEKFFAAILYIARYVGAGEEEFLNVHHNVWLRNMGERNSKKY